MADEVDNAQINIETMLAEHIRQSKRPEGPPPRGLCHNCDEPVGDGLRYCDKDCEADFNKRNRK